MRKLIVYIVLRAGAALTSFLATFWIAKSYASEKSALILVSLSLVLSVAAISRLGADVQLLRQASVSIQENDQGHVRAIFSTALIFCLALGVVGIGVLELFRGDLGGMYSVASFASISIGVVGVILLYLATEMLKALLYLNLAILLQAVLPYLLLVFLVAEFSGFSGDLAVASAFMLSGIFALAWVIFLLRPFRLDFRKVRNSSFVEGTLTYAPKAVIAFIFPQLPILLAGVLFLSDDVEAISVMLKLVMAVGLPVVAVNAFYSPLVARAYGARDFAGISALLVKSQLLCATSGFLVGALIWLAIPEILNFFDLPAEYSWPIKVALLAQLVNAITGPASVFSAMMRMDGFLSLASLFLLATFAVGLFLFTQYGPVSVIYAYALALVTENILVYCYCRYRLGKMSIQNKLAV